MLIDEMHFEFDLRFDRVASQDRPDFYDNEKDAYLNRAIKKWSQDRYGADNQKKAGFETSQERISNLMTLHIKYPVQPQLTPINLGDGLYEIRLSSLTFSYWFLTSAQVIITKDGCSKSIDHKAWQIDDMKNTFNEPNFDWGRVHANFGKSSNTTPTVNSDLSSLFFDTTNKYGEQQFTITGIRMNYIKTPDRVCLGTYKHIDDQTAPPLTALTNCDIHKDFHDEIVDMAVVLAARDVQDQLGYQTMQQIVQGDK